MKTNSVSGSQITFLWVNYHSSENATKATVGVVMTTARSTIKATVGVIYNGSNGRMM